MLLKDIIRLVQGTSLTGDLHAEKEISLEYTTSMMSSVLVLSRFDALMVTDLCGILVVRTALMSDIPDILITDGHQPTAAMIALAKASAISLATTAMDLSSVTDLLSKNGVNSLYH
ncbi:MAG: hypothetical protein LKE39_00745 [Sphaerochaeta sp.]|jgi:hypothetical protein|nr:hypothetical protein [Sphaerochaeta sp.]MCH3919025.1 hypothetical protein [Sphaerochaeta sp.]MCI2044899.1 hypothetical protein [Sphaerochaeta sp.]MCI2075794.1 hypothetical protein [Sphaerochaeta sp.]MCI2096433.1 hypothetical protein [Sphaerochaeta sp.]